MSGPPNVRCCISRAYTLQYIVHGGRYMVRVPRYRVGVSRQYRLDL